MVSRNLSDWETQHFGFVLSWFQHWRLRHELEPGRDAAVQFWKSQVQSKPRKKWQLDGWAHGMEWYLRWRGLCQDAGRKIGSVPERIHQATMKLGARRGLALSTRREYGSWAARFGEWAGSAGEATDPEAASAWLAWLVTEKQVGFETQKKALNAIVFFLKEVCGQEEVLLNVKLKKTRKREKVVMSAREVLAVLDKLDSNYRTPSRPIPEPPSGGPVAAT